jgi:hypothetical protein
VRDLCFVDGCGIIGPKFHHQRDMIPPGSSCTQFHVNSCLQWVRLIYPHIQSQFQKTVSQNKSVQPQALAAHRRLWYTLARLWLTKKGFGKALADQRRLWKGFDRPKKALARLWLTKKGFGKALADLYNPVGHAAILQTTVFSKE